MALLLSTYYGLTRLSELSPESKGWSTTDDNFQTLSLILRANELHQHGGATPINYPGFNFATPATPISPVLTEVTEGGSIPPGATIGVRLSYIDPIGLETEGAPEATIQLAQVPIRPTAPAIGDLTATPALTMVPGGSYIYVLTKRKGTSETDVSDATTVNIPFDPASTYAVPLSFDAGNQYTDGTDSLRLYRSTGFDAGFSLVTTITDMTQNTYTDINVLESTVISPPTANQFNQFEKVNIDWSALSHPASAQTLRIYVTREVGLWDVNHLLQEYPINDAATPLPSNVDYLGSEILAKGWPKEITQLVSQPPSVNLTTDAIGAPIYTTNADARGWQTYNFVLPRGVNQATPLPGAMYYDPTMATPAVRAYIGTVPSWQTLVQAGGSYTHPAQEQGGHSTDNIPFFRIGGPSVTNVLNTIATPVANFRKQVTKVSKPTATPVDLTTSSSSASYLVDMDTGLMNVDFAGQWIETNFNTHIFSDTLTTASVQLEIDGIKIAETLRSTTIQANTSASISISYATPTTRSNTRVKVVWWTSAGNLKSVGGRRTLFSKVLF